jgi:hypothetical protein
VPAGRGSGGSGGSVRADGGSVNVRTPVRMAWTDASDPPSYFGGVSP